MKYALVAALVMAMTLGTMPAKADNSEEVVIGVLGGILGGLIIGSAVERNRHRNHVYVYEEDYHEPVVRCYYRDAHVYDEHYDAVVKIKKRVCYQN